MLQHIIFFTNTHNTYFIVNQQIKFNKNLIRIKNKKVTI
jgi:hypothetical protein